MREPWTAIALRFVFVGTSVCLLGCTSTMSKGHNAASPTDYGYVSPARYNNHMAAMALESLHRIQINDVAGLRANLEVTLGLDVQTLWVSIQNECTTAEDR